MSRGSMEPEGNEGEPTWWDRNREVILNIRFRIADLSEVFEKPTDVSALNDTKLQNKENWTHTVRQELLEALTKKFGTRAEVSVGQFCDYLRLRKYSSVVERDAIFDFLDAIGRLILRQKGDLFLTMRLDNDFREQYPNSEDLQDDKLELADRYAADGYIALKLFDQIYPDS